MLMDKTVQEFTKGRNEIGAGQAALRQAIPHHAAVVDQEERVFGLAHIIDSGPGNEHLSAIGRS